MDQTTTDIPFPSDLRYSPFGSGDGDGVVDSGLDVGLLGGTGRGPPGGGSMRKKKTIKHPVAALFHVIFKFLAFVFYLFGGLFGQDFISTFVAVILLISMDFWVVKNVTGRLLAGLRWSNYIDDVGNSHWIFENKNAAKDYETPDGFAGFKDEIRGTADSSIFWTALIIAPMLWLLFMLASIFRLNVQWFMLVALASVLSLSNLYGYIRCRLGTSDIKSSVTQFVAKQTKRSSVMSEQSCDPITGHDEAETLAKELADEYIDYLSIDLKQQQCQVDDSIEELLTHLEEVCSVLENYKTKSVDIESIPALIASKRSSLEELFRQVDELERHVSDTDMELDKLDIRMKEYESKKRSSTNPIYQVMGLLSRTYKSVKQQQNSL